MLSTHNFVDNSKWPAVGTWVKLNGVMLTTQCCDGNDISMQAVHPVMTSLCHNFHTLTSSTIHPLYHGIIKHCTLFLTQLWKYKVSKVPKERLTASWPGSKKWAQFLSQKLVVLKDSVFCTLTPSRDKRVMLKRQC